MDIREIQSLVTLSRTGSIKRAADTLHLTPSAIHRHLKLLSEELGVQLYEKFGMSLRLTAAATHLLPMMQALLVQHREILSAAADLENLRRGSVRIGSGPTFSSYALPQLLELFRGAHPGVDVFLESGHSEQLLSELEEGTMDALFLVPGPLDSRFAVEAMWEFEVPLVARPGIAPSRRTRLRSLKDKPFLLYKKGSYFEAEIERYLESHGVEPRASMRLDNAEPIKALVRSGFGISLLPEWVVDREVKAGDLVKVPVAEPPLRSRVALIRRRTPHTTAALAALISIAKRWRFGARH
jgi:DNA-binding transcriptional LysR family regulator